MNSTLLRARIVAIHVKPETPGEPGLPKRPLPAADVTLQGLKGDYNRYRTRRKQGDPAMAVLLLPMEVLNQLQAEGWPVRPGDLGENFTLRGIPHSAFAPGQRFRAGPEVVLEITRPCTPCRNLYVLPYVGPQRGPAFVATLQGRRGWYARVLRPGRVRPGDSLIQLVG